MCVQFEAQIARPNSRNLGRKHCSQSQLGFEFNDPHLNTLKGIDWKAIWLAFNIGLLSRNVKVEQVRNEMTFLD